MYRNWDKIINGLGETKDLRKAPCLFQPLGLQSKQGFPDRPLQIGDIVELVWLDFFPKDAHTRMFTGQKGTVQGFGLDASRLRRARVLLSNPFFKGHIVDWSVDALKFVQKGILACSPTTDAVNAEPSADVSYKIHHTTPGYFAVSPRKTYFTASRVWEHVTEDNLATCYWLNEADLKAAIEEQARCSPTTHAPTATTTSPASPNTSRYGAEVAPALALVTSNAIPAPAVSGSSSERTFEAPPESLGWTRPHGTYHTKGVYMAWRTHGQKKWVACHAKDYVKSKVNRWISKNGGTSDRCCTPEIEFDSIAQIDALCFFAL